MSKAKKIGHLQALRTVSTSSYQRFRFFFFARGGEGVQSWSAAENPPHIGGPRDAPPHVCLMVGIAFVLEVRFQIVFFFVCFFLLVVVSKSEDLDFARHCKETKRCLFRALRICIDFSSRFFSCFLPKGGVPISQ